MSAITESLIELTDPGEAGRHIAALNMDLALEREITAAVAAAVDEIVGSVSDTDWQRWLRISQDLETHALTAVIDAQRAVSRRQEGLSARNDLRSALGRLAQALTLIGEDAPVSPERSPKELARWLVTTLDAPQRELADVLGVPLRTFQRWASERDRVQPEGADADRLRLFAAVVNQLRFSLTASGVVRWFHLTNSWLDGRRPLELLADPLTQPRLLAAAGALRESGGS